MNQHEGMVYARSTTGGLWHLGRLAETGNGAILLQCSSHVLHTSRAETQPATEPAPQPTCATCLHFSADCGPDCPVRERRTRERRERYL